MNRKKSNLKKLLPIFILFIFSFSYFLFKFLPSASPINTKEATVIKVVDGDTLKVKLNGRYERVRMLGIDTPESVHPDPSKNCIEGKIASNFTKSLIDKKKVRLEFEGRTRDVYNRLLAYVWDGDKMVNLELVKNGYAKTFMVNPSNKYFSELKNAENKARKQKKGIWK